MRHLTLIPNPTLYSPTHALHISYDCLSGEYSFALSSAINRATEVLFKPHLQLISAHSNYFHLVLNNGTALYHLVIEICTDHTQRDATPYNPFEFMPCEPLTTGLTLLHDTRDCWHSLAEDEIRLVEEALSATHTAQPAARLTVRSTLKFDAEQYLSGLVKRMVGVACSTTWEL